MSSSLPPTPTHTLLHVVGSPKDAFKANMSVMHGRAHAKAGHQVEGLRLVHWYAVVHPGGAWSFPLDLSEREVADSKKVDLTSAMVVIREMGVDLVMMHVHTTTKNYKTLFELLDIPVIGTGGEASANVADKATTRALLLQAGLPVAPGLLLQIAQFTREDFSSTSLLEKHCLALPLVVKPTRMEASVGVVKVDTMAELDAALLQAFNYGDTVLVDTFIPGREVRSAALQVQDRQFVLLPVIEYQLPSMDSIREVANKVTTNGKKLLPAPYFYLKQEDQPELVAKMQDLAARTHAVLGCRDFSFIDCRLNEHGQLFILECNVFAAFNPGSVMTKMTEGAGICHQDFWGTMVRRGLARGRGQKFLKLEESESHICHSRGQEEQG